MDDVDSEKQLAMDINLESTNFDDNWELEELPHWKDKVEKDKESILMDIHSDVDADLHRCTNLDFPNDWDMDGANKEKQRVKHTNAAIVNYEDDWEIEAGNDE